MSKEQNKSKTKSLSAKWKNAYNLGQMKTCSGSYAIVLKVCTYHRNKVIKVKKNIPRKPTTWILIHKSLAITVTCILQGSESGILIQCTCICTCH